MRLRRSISIALSTILFSISPARPSKVLEGPAELGTGTGAVEPSLVPAVDSPSGARMRLDIGRHLHPRTAIRPPRPVSAAATLRGVRIRSVVEPRTRLHRRLLLAASLAAVDPADPAAQDSPAPRTHARVEPAPRRA